MTKKLNMIFSVVLIGIVAVVSVTAMAALSSEKKKLMDQNYLIPVNNLSTGNLSYVAHTGDVTFPLAHPQSNGKININNLNPYVGKKNLVDIMSIDPAHFTSPVVITTVEYDPISAKILGCDGSEQPSVYTVNVDYGSNKITISNK